MPGIICIFFVTAKGYDSSDIHPFIRSGNYCIKCHVKDKRARTADPSLACAEFCLSCHRDVSNHHSINVKILEKLPDGFNLAGSSRLTCTTCHNLKTVRFDTSSWKSESLYEKVFKGSSTYKTYFLVVKNNDGQLCKNCH